MLRIREVQPNESSLQLERIRIDTIRPNPYQPRRTFDEQALSALASSLHQNGLLQPIQVRRMNAKTYELIAGERRLRAARMLGWTHIDAIVSLARDTDSAIVAMIENLQREDLHFLEEAEGYLGLISDHGLTQEELARKLGRTQSCIANKLRLLKLPQSVRDRVSAAGLSERHARALLRIHDSNIQAQTLEMVIKQELSVRATEALVENLLTRLGTPAVPSDGQPQTRVQRARKERNFRLLGGYRLFVNTVRRAIKDLQENGIQARYLESASDDAWEIRLIIPRK